MHFNTRFIDFGGIGIFATYSITCIQRPLKGSNESGLLQQVVFECRFYWVDLRRVAVSEQWFLKAGGLLTLSQTSPGFYVSAVQVFRKHCGKRRNCS